MKCAACLAAGATFEQLLDRDWPPDAVTVVRGSAYCAVHAAEAEVIWQDMIYRRADLKSAINAEKRKGRNSGLLHAAQRAVAFFDRQLAQPHESAGHRALTEGE